MSDQVKIIFKAVLFACVAFSSTVCQAQVLKRGEDILDAVQKYRQAEVTIVYPGFDAMSLLARDFSVSSCNGKSAVLSLSPLTDTLFIIRNISYTLVQPDAIKSVYTASSVAEAMQWHSYPTYKQYDSIMHIIANTYPYRCRLDTIGLSVDGRVIYAIKISDNPAVDEDKPKVFLTSTMHGNELCGFVMMMHLAEKLASGGSSDNLIAAINEGLEVWINPLSNPDGTYTSGDTITSPTRDNANYVDLNRNFPDPVVSTDYNQPEIAEMVKFLKKHKFILSVNFHSGTEVVNYPWDRWTKLHPDNDWFYDISRRYADTVHLHSASGYMDFLNDGITNGAVWYEINGGRQDYVTWSLHGREVTIELDNTYQTPATKLETLWNSNYRSFLRYINEALSGVKGFVTDSLTSKPLAAEVYISGHDADNSQVYSDTLTGSYNRLLAPGTWDISFIADGYKTYVAENVAVTWDAITHLNVALSPEITTVEKLNIRPVPSSGNINILLPDKIEGDVRFIITDISGRMVYTFTSFCTNGTLVPVDLSWLSSGIYFVTAKDMSDNTSVTGRVVIVKGDQ
jgi:hypothetical protein